VPGSLGRFNTKVKRLVMNEKSRLFSFNDTVIVNAFEQVCQDLNESLKRRL